MLTNNNCTRACKSMQFSFLPYISFSKLCCLWSVNCSNHWLPSRDNVLSLNAEKPKTDNFVPFCQGCRVKMLWAKWSFTLVYLANNLYNHTCTDCRNAEILLLLISHHFVYFFFLSIFNRFVCFTASRGLFIHMRCHF